MKNIIRCISFFLIVFSASSLHAQMFGQEPTERQRTYDVENIKIEVTLDLKKKTVDGTVTTSIHSLIDKLAEFKVDAVGMNIKSVKSVVYNQTDKPELAETYEDVKFEYDDKEITIHPGYPVANKFPFKYRIEYSTTSPEKGLYFIQPSETFPNKRYEVWSQGEGEDNRYWFPCYDYPNDKATTEIIVRTDAAFQTLSNGRLLNTADNGDGTKTWHWIMDKPHSSYLVMLAIGNWDVIEDRYLDIPVNTLVPPGTKDMALKSFDRTADIVKFFSEYAGYKYPWGSFSQVVVQDFIYGGMENTGAVVLTDVAVYDERTPPDYTAVNLVAHELAHMWWGDATTCKNWNEIWLNESFATYFQCLYTEHIFGKDEFDYNIYRNGNNSINVDSLVSRKPIYVREGLTTNTYEKGSVVLNMLRYVLGEELFKKSMNTYITANEFRNVTTKDLYDAVMKAKHNPQLDHERDMDWFFNEWIYHAGQPEYTVNYRYDEESGQCNIKFLQVQAVDSVTSLFKTPVPVEIITESGKQTVYAIPDTIESGIFAKVSSKPLCVIFNKGNIVLSKLHFTKPKEDWLYQLTNSENAIDRITAIKGLHDFLDDNNAVQAMYKAAASDKFWGVRYEAISALSKSKAEGVFDMIVSLFAGESDSRVKRAIITNLVNLKDSPEAKRTGIINVLHEFLKQNVQGAKSYYIISDAINIMPEVLPKDKVYDEVAPFLSMDSHADVIRRYALDALGKIDDPRTLDVFLKYAVGGASTRTRNNALSGLRNFLSDPRAIEVINGSLLDMPRSIQYTALGLVEKSLNRESLQYVQELMFQSHDERFRNRIKTVLDKF